MIKKLKIKFIAINMFFVVTIMLLLLGGFFVLECNNERKQIEHNLQLFVERNGDFRPAIGEEKKPRMSVTKIIPTFIVEVDEKGNITQVRDRQVEVESTVVNRAVALVLNAGEEKGILENFSLEYRMEKRESGSIIVFTDVSFSQKYLRELMIRLLILFFAGILVFFIISICLAKFAVQPVERAWNRQKQFIADASHELKTPLTIILTNLDIMEAHREEKIAEQQKWFLNTKEEAKRMRHLLEDLLFLAKSDAASMPIARQEVDFSYLVLGSALLFESIAYENKIQLNEDIEQNIFMFGEENQLRQLVGILLDNACKYAKGGRVDVVLRKVQDKVLFEVRNTVADVQDLIPKEEIENIFERFYRVDKSRARTEGGYGLGLSIAKMIVKNHQGKIKVRSDMEVGTVFSIKFPI